MDRALLFYTRLSDCDWDHSRLARVHCGDTLGAVRPNSFTIKSLSVPIHVRHPNTHVLALLLLFASMTAQGNHLNE